MDFYSLVQNCSRQGKVKDGKQSFTVNHITDFFVCISSNWIIEAIGRGSNCYPFFHVDTFAGLSIAECLILLLSFTEMEPQKIWRDALDFILDSRSMKKHILNSDSLCEVGISVYGINKKVQRPKHGHLTLTC